ncbi:nickel-dependent lactate racemase family protein [Deferrisoma camini]|uniref:lactate racemase domain-containing protein n=1 Tax=Deferrisoma camini TaxID=1035120 RepID=UPI00046D8506|nr:lactate racemase domain-containing protein [Deferrisoma camini]
MQGPIPWIPVEQEIPSPRLADPAEALRRALAQAPPPPRGPVAVPVGSRHIPGLPDLVAELVAHLREAGADPVVVPAMGTHGGATAEGQARTLAGMGITPEAVGAPVVSRPEVVCLGEAAPGLPVWCDRVAAEARAVVPLHRVKPHTAFRGVLESGPTKLLAVGLGKARSARAVHRYGPAQALPAVLRFWLESGRVPFGVALVPNGRGGVAELRVLEPGSWPREEHELLELSRRLAPRLPWDELDLLVVERIGKDVSGTGMDLHVIGMERRFPGCGATPRIRRIVALELTPASAGNANGVGYADVVTRRLAEHVDWPATYANCRATGFLEAARLPYVAENEDRAVEAALDSLAVEPGEVRAVRIRDTAHLDRFWVSPVLARDLPPGVHRICG